MAQRLAIDPAVALLANTIATGGALVAILLVFGPVSGAHLNPAVTIILAATKQLTLRLAMMYVVAQVLGAIIGAILANAMFDLPLATWSQTVRTGSAQWGSEAVATFGLIGVVIGVGRTRPTITPLAVAAYIVAAYWFTASTSFANPAVTIGRAFSDSYAGIRPVDIGGFIVAQAVGAALGTVFFSWLYAPTALAAIEARAGSAGESG